MSGIEIKRLKEESFKVIQKLSERDVENPEYLRKQGQKDFQKIIARFRCGNEELRNKSCVNRRRNCVEYIRRK